MKTSSNVVTLVLTENAQSVEFLGAYPYYWIHNLSDSEAYASLGIPEADSDGTYTIPAGASQRISGGAAGVVLSLIGSGKVQIIATERPECPCSFKSSAEGGGTLNADDIVDSIDDDTDSSAVPDVGAVTGYVANADEAVKAEVKSYVDGKIINDTTFSTDTTYSSSRIISLTTDSVITITGTIASGNKSVTFDLSKLGLSNNTYKHFKIWLLGVNYLTHQAEGAISYNGSYHIHADYTSSILSFSISDSTLTVTSSADSLWG